jgi:hypothetical protein
VDDEIKGACRPHGKDKIFYKNFVEKLKGRHLLKEQA